MLRTTLRQHRNIVVLVGTIVFVALAASLQWWLPNLLGIFFRMGLIAPISVAGVEIQMEKSWVPIRSSEGGLLRLKAKRPTVVLAKSRCLPFEDAYLIVIGKIGSTEAAILEKDGPHHLGTKQFPWGTAILLTGGRSVFIKEYGLVISDDDSKESYLPAALNDIREIRYQER